MTSTTMRKLALVAGITAGALALAGVAMASPSMLARISTAPAGAVAASVDTSAPVVSVDTSAPVDSVDTSVPTASVDESPTAPAGETSATIVPTSVVLQRGTLRYSAESSAPVTVSGKLISRVPWASRDTSEGTKPARTRTPLAGMTVRLFTSAGHGGKLVDSGLTAVTDADGSFTFLVVPQRAMRVRVVFDGADGYKRSHSRVLVLQPSKSLKQHHAKGAAANASKSDQARAKHAAASAHAKSAKGAGKAGSVKPNSRNSGNANGRMSH